MHPWPVRNLLLLASAVPILIAGPATHARATPSASERLEQSLSAIGKSLPADAAGFASFDPAAIARQATEAERAAAALALAEDHSTTNGILAALERLLTAKDRAENLFDQTLALRGQFASLSAGEPRQHAVRAWLRTVSLLTDLCGRMRYLLFDAIGAATTRLGRQPESIDQLGSMLMAHRSTIGAAVVATALPSPEGSAVAAASVGNSRQAARILDIIAACDAFDLVPRIAALLRTRGLSPELTIRATEAIREVGLPQDPRPDQDAKLPKPAITARELHALVSRIDAKSLDAPLASRQAELLAWLAKRKQRGLDGDSYQFAGMELRAGDWLLMRNPSPYNLFTDLSPGLFTHVGVVALETGPDGLGRMVIVDQPERGTTLPATNVDLFVQRTLHYVFLRHPDPAVAHKMGEVAASIIGNETEFDLNFRTDRVTALRGQSLAGQKIKTYCGGVLLLCAQETTQRREDFFPIPEGAAGGRTAENLATLGLSIGKDFVSPTGALFSPQLEVVGRREAMYDPGREIEEAVFDYFATGLIEKKLVPSSNWSQALRLKLAQASTVTPLLGRALAKAAGVSPELDLVAAAKAAAVIETLDEAAYRASGDFRAARDAIRAGPLDLRMQQGRSRQETERMRAIRNRHAALYREWAQGTLSPRDLRASLVKYYIDQGRRELDQRFFSQ